MNRLVEALRSLPRESREIVAAFLGIGCKRKSESQIAYVLRLPRNVVHARLARGLAALRELQ